MSIKEKVMEKITQGSVAMRPRWQFVLKAALAVAGTLVVFVVLLYLASFILFVLRQNGMWFAPGFGFRGVFVFLRSLPWVLIFVSLIFVAIVEVLIRRYAFAFRRPLAYSMLGVLIVTVAGSFFIAETRLHRGLYERARVGGLPVAGPLYREFGMHRFRDIHPGTIASTTNDGLIIVTPRGETVTVQITPQTRFPFGFDVGEGDGVVVMGEREGDVVRAFGIRGVDNPFELGNGRMRGGRRPEFHMRWISE